MHGSEASHSQLCPWKLPVNHSPFFPLHLLNADQNVALKSLLKMAETEDGSPWRKAACRSGTLAFHFTWACFKDVRTYCRTKLENITLHSLVTIVHTGLCAKTSSISFFSSVYICLLLAHKLTKRAASFYVKYNQLNLGGVNTQGSQIEDCKNGAENCSIMTLFMGRK